MTENNCVEFSINEHIAWLRLNSPERHNSLSSDDIDAFTGYLSDVENNKNIRVLIITGAGKKTFCSGVSLSQLSSGNISGDLFVSLTDKLAAIKIPTICALNGSAYGGGAELGICCDFRVGVRGMRLFVPPARLGICYPVNGIRRYIQRLGLDMSKRLLVANEEFSGEELLAKGYLSHLVEPEELEKFVENMAEKISQLAPLAVTAMNQLCNQIADGALDEKTANALVQQCNKSEDLQEGLAAIKEKRKPFFKGC